MHTLFIAWEPSSSPKYNSPVAKAQIHVPEATIHLSQVSKRPWFSKCNLLISNLIFSVKPLLAWVDFSIKFAPFPKYNPFLLKPLNYNFVTSWTTHQSISQMTIEPPIVADSFFKAIFHLLHWLRFISGKFSSPSSPSLYDYIPMYAS